MFELNIRARNLGTAFCLVLILAPGRFTGAEDGSEGPVVETFERVTQPDRKMGVIVIDPPVKPL